MILKPRGKEAQERLVSASENAGVHEPCDLACHSMGPSHRTLFLSFAGLLRTEVYTQDSDHTWH